MWKKIYMQEQYLKEELYISDKDEFIPLWEYVGTKNDMDVYRNRRNGDIIRHCQERILSTDQAALYLVDGKEPDVKYEEWWEIYDGNVYSDDRYVRKVFV